MTAKIRVDIQQGILEAEGSEEFVRKIYEDHREALGVQFAEAATTGSSKQRGQANGAKDRVKEADKKEPQKPGKPEKTKKKPRDKNAPLTVLDLDLSGLAQYVKRWKLTSNYEYNLVFAHYLTEELEIEKLTPDHFFTCYSVLPDVKIPRAVIQSLRDTKHNKHWLDTADQNDIKITTHGKNHFQHEMRPAEES